MVGQGAVHGLWAVEDPRFTAVYLFHGMHGIVDDAMAAGQPVKRAQLIRKLQQLCFRVVGAVSTP